MTAETEITTARVQDDLSKANGAKLLVDRIWPRGLRKADLRLDDWIKEVAPTTELRKWFAHDPRKWDEFRVRYCEELDDNADAVGRCLAWCRKGPVMLLFAARNREHNQAVVLREYLLAALD